jgi:hypothetical protein
MILKEKIFFLRISKLWILFFLIITDLIFPQSGSDSLDIIVEAEPLNVLSTSFDKQLNTYSLNSGLFFYKTFGGFKLRLSENFNSKFVKTGEKNIRDEQKLLLLTSYKILSNLEAGISAENKILSDNRRIEINQASMSGFSLYTLYSPHPGLAFSPFAGYSNNRQIGENDYGFIYGAEAAASDFELSDININSQLKIRNEDISPRKNLLRYVNLVFKNDFDRNVSNSINARFTQNRRDFYYTADPLTSVEFNVTNNIQSRIETGYIVEDHLRFGKFFNIFTLDALGKINYREIDRNTRYRSSNVNSTSVFDTKINELKVELESVIRYESELFSGYLRGIYSERDEKNITKNFSGSNPFFFEERSKIESQKNNNAVRGSLSLSGIFNFSHTDKLHVSLLQNKLRYDTPSSENFDDRDEILSITRIKYSKQLTPFFEAFVNTEGTYSHIVYLFEQRSSNNNINRILKLAAGGNYFGKNVSSSNIFEVTANYTVYDFEDLNPNFKSFSFRQFTAIDSSTIKIFKNLSAGIYGYLKLAEQGDFKWSSFSARPTRFLEEIYAEPKIIIDILGIKTSLGLRYFTLKTFNFKGLDKIKDSEYLSRGPLMEIFLLIKEVLYLRIYGWYEFITINNNIEQEQANVIMQVNWTF